MVLPIGPGHVSRRRAALDRAPSPREQDDDTSPQTPVEHGPIPSSLRFPVRRDIRDKPADILRRRHERATGEWIFVRHIGPPRAASETIGTIIDGPPEDQVTFAR
jgi:hypothetical protein